MIYRVHVVVLRAIPNSISDSLNAAAYTFGINADSTADAVSRAVAAAQDATDRAGDYVGGIVLEAHCRSLARNEFDGYEKYFHTSSKVPGIFYVSGITYTGVHESMIGEAQAALEVVKERIGRFGLPAPSFIHPPMLYEPPSRVRMLCLTCGHWVEVYNTGIIYSLMGTDMFTPEDENLRVSMRLAGNFMRKHLDQCADQVVGIQEDDKRWAMLDDANREDDSQGR